MTGPAPVLEVAGGLCVRCLCPVTAVADGPGRLVWLASPIRPEARWCPVPDRHGRRGPHRIRRTEGLAVAGLVTVESIDEEALELSAVGLALVHHVHHRAARRLPETA